ncbi:putative ATPase [Salinarchaeum sp. Harcht-Bsk1]|uniref:ATP-binding protein n=1 Tax=Salinarchaeum sp. Harcht-Bsk1 TaxID=1333523 RepID=UPI000342459C|nr:ATP-binding protein [Salinarchaeum sp. Harcht-Bsk1]AGN02082.1 putative ATPase [Salinarchaeum sp. Harcht-Bsk1]
MALDDFTEYDPDEDDASGDAVEDESARDADEEATDVHTASEASADDAAGLTYETADAEAPERVDGLGILSTSRGLRIDETGEETELQAYVTAPNRSDVRVGSYVLVPYPERGDPGASGERLFCRVAGLEYAQEFQSDDATELRARRAMREGAIDETDYKFLADLDPVAIIYEDGIDEETGDPEQKRRATDRVPKPETTVHRARDADEIKTGLKIPGDGIFLGHLAVGGERVTTAAAPPTIDYRLNDDYTAGDPLLFRHTLIAGGTGSGKTHAAKNVLRQVLDDERTYPMGDGREVQAAVVQFDPQDEYAQLHDDNPDLDADTARQYEREGIANGGHDDTLAFVPKVGSATYDGGGHRAEQVEFTVPFSMVRGNPWLVAGSGLNDNQYQALHELLDRFFGQYGSDGTYDQFTEFMDDPALREELDETGRVHEATFDAVFRRVRGFGHVFDQDARPITDQVRDLVRPGGLSVVPTYHISDSRAAEVVVLAVATLLVDEKLSSDPTYDRIKDTPLIVGMDEAHNYLTDADSVQARRVIGTFTDAAKQGRKERLGLFLVTQDPQDIHDAVFKQINSTVVLNLGDEDAISAVNIPTALEQKVPYMEQGQMVVYSPDNSEPVELVGLEHCLVKHE